ncbi:MAG TPA: hypothetical protein VMT52_16320 [Planctomycetota bacterium]|nr:hypothetical protein [Planctomycetota bacterium]
MTKAYLAVSCLLTGAILAAAAFSAIAAAVAPAWAEGAGKRFLMGIARLGGVDTAARPPSAAPVVGPAALGTALGPEPPALAHAGDGAALRIQRGALESRLTELEARVPGILGTLTEGPSRFPARADRALEAWETVRDPLLLYLNAAARPGRDAEALGETADIVDLAPRLVSRLESLRRERADLLKAVFKTLDPAALARVLTAEGAEASDARAMSILFLLPPRSASELLERLSRYDPARAARLLEAWVARPGGGSPE